MVAQGNILGLLESLKAEREELNALISGIEKRVGVVSTTPAKISLDDIPQGYFKDLSQPAAAEKLLRINPPQTLRTPEMLAAFRKSGMYLNPKNATTILYTALLRNPKFERVDGKSWGLAEWYRSGK